MVKHLFSGLLLLVVGLLLGACQPATEQNTRTTEIDDTILAFGTFVEVTLVGVDEADRDLVMDRIEKDLAYFHYAFHPWQRGPTARVNQLLAATGEFTSSPSLIPLIRKSREYSRLSQGLFNPAIGRLIALWGYHSDDLPEGPHPADSDIQALLTQKPSMQSIEIKGVRISNTNPAVQLDFGGIAKGYALDVVLDHLRQMGVKNAIINTGGDLKAIGKHGDRPWSIGIRDPRGKGNLGGLDIKDNEAVFTSGDYERFYIEAGIRYHHILDPRTGYPARNASSVTVVHQDAALADAAATALFVAGPEHWLDIARSMGIEQAMLVNRQGVIFITPALRKRIQFSKPNLDIRVVNLRPEH